MTLTAEADGWPAVREAVLRRDRHSCVAVWPSLWVVAGRTIDVMLSVAPCRNRIEPGEPILRLDHVDMFKKFLRKAPDSEAFLQAVCDYHHYAWATSAMARHASRERLSLLYPEEWAEWIAR